MNLLKVAVEEHELKSQRVYAKERFLNPKKHILEDEYAIRYPRCSTLSSSSFPDSSSLLSEESDFRMVVPRHIPSTATSSSTFSGSPFLSAEEESDFRMAVSLQAELNNQTLCGGSTADCVTFREGNEESNYCGMFVPCQGWKAPTSEPESSAHREEETANALVQLQRDNIPENTH